MLSMDNFVVLRGNETASERCRNDKQLPSRIFSWFRYRAHLKQNQVIKIQLLARHFADIRKLHQVPKENKMKIRDAGLNFQGVQDPTTVGKIPNPFPSPIQIQPNTGPRLNSIASNNTVTRELENNMNTALRQAFLPTTTVKGGKLPAPSKPRHPPLSPGSLLQNSRSQHWLLLPICELCRCHGLDRASIAFP